jgi:pyruvate dehydrogenase E2 component (dihydrolipoamide acetyltransferase)
VSAGDVIAEIETDKATMEIEAVDEGEVLEILVAEATEGVKVNTVIARLAGEDGAKAPGAKPASQPAAADKVPVSAEQPSSAGGGTSAGDKPVHDVVPSQAKTSSGDRVFSSPLARRLAKQAELDLGTLKGTGPHGRVVKRDVEAAAKGGARPEIASAPATSTASSEPRKAQSLAQMGIADGSYDLIPLDGMRKAIACRISL